jgi:hypothetical protein
LFTNAPADGYHEAGDYAIHSAPDRLQRLRRELQRIDGKVHAEAILLSDPSQRHISR